MPELTHMSYSTYNSYKNCPRQMYLGKVRGAWSRGAWFFIIGTAVHEGIEARLKGEPFDLKASVYRAVEEQMRTDPDVDAWHHGTYEDEPARKEKALKLAQDCLIEAYRWLDEELEEIVLIEADLSGNLPGCEVPIKAYADILGKHRKHGWSIVDWKSSAAKPKDNFQLETYRALLLTQGVDRYDTGLWAMLRPGASKARKIDLSNVDPAEVGAKYQAVYEKIKAGVFPTEHGYNCRTCVHDLNCGQRSPGTERSNYYDDVSRNLIPF